MPRDFDLAALTALGTTLSLDPRGNLTWDDPDFGFGVIKADEMPVAARANPWLDAVGGPPAAARDLPFGRIAIAPAQRSTSSSTTDGLDVQSAWTARASRSTSSWGSAECTTAWSAGTSGWARPTCLLHWVISQLALAYPPESLQLHPLDFKEVEFDAYLTERLPHARAITSRTDRERAETYLRRFHDEIDRRARLCREAKVTDLPDYRPGDRAGAGPRAG